MAKQRRVYVPQVDKIFNTVAAAAKDLNVSAANLSNALAGRRKSVGGYNVLDASSYIKKGKTVKPNLRGMRNKAAKMGYTVFTASAAAPSELVVKLSDLLKDVNNKTKELRAKNLEYFAKGNKNARLMIDDIGANAGGYYKTDYATLSQLSEAQLKKFIAAIQAAQKYETYTSAGAEKVATVRARALGFMSKSQMLKYKDVLPYFLDTLDALKGNWQYEERLQNVVDAMVGGATTERVIQLLSETQDQFATETYIYDMIDYYKYSKTTKRNVDKIIELYDNSKNAVYYASTLNAIKKMLAEGASQADINNFAVAVSKFDEDTLKNISKFIDTDKSSDFTTTLKTYLQYLNEDSAEII